MEPPGEGTLTNPYQVYAIENLYWITQNPTSWTKCFAQMANIDAASSSVWDDGAGFTPIGNSTTKFSGLYNGQGYTISNLFINRPETNDVGFFGKFYNAYIRNLSLVNVNITGANNVGGLVGDTYNLSNISNCFVTGTVNGVDNVGGLAGNCSQSVISNSFSKGTVNSTGNASGGFVGTSRFGSDIYNCFSRAEVIGNTKVGGLVGDNVYENNQLITIVNCYSTGHVSGISEIGGLIGANGGDVINSFFDYVSSGLFASAGGVGYDTEAMQSSTIYANADWDLNFCWAFNSEMNSGYPYLLQPISPVGTAPTNGDGTYENPFEIATLQNLVWLSKSPIHWDKYFIQTANIDAAASQTEGWNWSYGFSPIGNNKWGFGGQYNGQGFSITNLNIERDIWSNIGLFGYTVDARIQDLNIENAEVNGKRATGLIVGQAAGNTVLVNCHSSGIVNGLWKDIGGMVGFGSCVLWECSSSAGVNGSTSVGGLFGQTSGAHIFKSFSTGNVEGLGNVGGLVGANQQSQIVQSYALGNVVGESVIGGLVGLNTSNSLVSNCYATGTVSTTDYGGGLIGRCLNSGNVINSYSVGLVTGTSMLGGMIAFSNFSTITNSFWDINTSGQSISGGGTGKTTTEMMDVATFTNLTAEGLTEPWDFVYNPNDDVANENIWNISDVLNNGYPFLNWQCPIPQLEWQPQIEEACEGGTAIFSFSVSSASSVEYQWQIKTDGEFEDITDANSGELAFANVLQAHNSALFRCIATNDCGYLISDEAELIVLAPTLLVSEPESQTTCAGETVEFTVEATGSYLYYEWYKNDVQIEGFEGIPTLTLTNIAEEDNGTYKCVVIGDCGAVESQEVVLTVLETTIISIEPQDQTVCIGQDAAFSVEATGSNLNYEWYKNNLQIEGIEGLPTLTLTNVTEEDNGTYKCVVTGDCGTVESQEVTLNVVVLDVSINYIEDNYLSANIEGAEYQWFYQENDCNQGLNLTLIEGETGQVLIPPFLNGYYVVQVISNGCSQLSDCVFHVWGSASSSTINQLTLFPNPANNKVTIGNLSGAKGTLRIINLLGKTIDEISVEGEEYTVDISIYPKGIYIFKVTTGSIILRGLLVKN
jgi:hypothetical protein